MKEFLVYAGGCFWFVLNLNSVEGDVRCILKKNNFEKNIYEKH